MKILAVALVFMMSVIVSSCEDHAYMKYEAFLSGYCPTSISLDRELDMQINGYKIGKAVYESNSKKFSLIFFEDIDRIGSISKLTIKPKDFIHEKLFIDVEVGGANRSLGLLDSLVVSCEEQSIMNPFGNSGLDSFWETIVDSLIQHEELKEALREELIRPKN